MIYGNVKIGKNVGIGHNTVIHAYESIIIKDDAKIAPYCFIVDSNHQIDGVKNCVGVPQTKPITIGKGVWIGTHSVILMGVEIGDGSVIGAGSVLTKNVPEKEIWAGNPARFIKKIQ